MLHIVCHAINNVNFQYDSRKTKNKESILWRDKLSLEAD